MKNFNRYIIDADNLRCNVTLIKRLLKDGVKLCAVVKADAYGVGVENVCKLIDSLVDFYAVSNVSEAKEIRDLGYSTNILVLGAVPISEVEYCAKNNISISVDDNDYLMSIMSIVQNDVVNVHLKVNTGLNRYGYKNKKQFLKAINLIQKSKVVHLEGCFTHFATKGNDVEFINEQKAIMDEYCKMLPEGVIRHCANSYATLLSSTYQMDMVRVGANLYGDIRNEKLPLKNVVSIKGEVVSISNIKKGESIGYDRSYIASSKMRIAVVPLGYADGITRLTSNKYYCLINGQKARIVGNVCMDCVILDITDIDNVYIGTEVTVVGTDKDKELRLCDWAKAIGTSPYEVLVNFRRKRCKVIIKNSSESIK